MGRTRRIVEAVGVGVVCGWMGLAPGVGAAQVGAKLPVERHAKALTEQERVLQALNRFTFGPRPGDVVAVERMGLQRWFEMELHPERIDDAGFVAEMREFPAMGLPARELRERFPSGQVIRQLGKVGGAVPWDPVERAIYRDASYADGERLRVAKAGPGQVGGADMHGVPMPSVGTQVPGSGPGAPAALAGASLPAEEVERAIYADGSYADGGWLRAAEAQGAVAGPGQVGGAGMHGVSMPPVGTQVPGSGPGAPAALAGVRLPAEEVEAVLRMGPEERFGRLVGMGPEEMLEFREAVKGKDRVRLVEGLTPAQREAVEAMVESPERVVATEDAAMRLLRDIDSRRQLQAVMTEFWLNHFNVYLRKNEQEPYMLPAYEEQTILPHALGKFEDLLVATAESPAMLMYLDNWESVGPGSDAGGGRLRAAGAPAVVAGEPVKGKAPKGINENYGRELMELHTLGVGGGYTQQDVIEVAKCFTGWTIERPYGGGGGKGAMLDAGTPGEFVFEPRRHEPGAKVVLGHTIPESGMNEGLEVLHLLATRPATAHFISQELAVRFVSDNPPAALVKRMAATYLKTDGDISAVLRTMFKAKEFWTPGVYRAKVKTPLEFLASAVRASDATVTNPLPLVQAMDRLGMPVWGMQTPNGYGWTAEDWVSSNGLLSRMNFALVLSGNRVAGVRTDWAGMVGSADASAATERVLEGDLLGEGASGRTREAVMAEFGSPTAQAEAAASFDARPVVGAGLVRAAAVRAAKQREVPLDTMAGLLLGSPEFQRR